MKNSVATHTVGAAALTFLLLTSCTQQMANQPRYEPLEESSFFADHRSSRSLPMGVVARGSLDQDGQPAEITREILERGRDRFNIFCTPCHDRLGTGQGMVVRRGFRRGPPSFHIDRLREVPLDHFYDVMTNGFGAMNDYAAQIKPRDRWAIAAYIRTLQLSQNATPELLPPDVLDEARKPRPGQEAADAPEGGTNHGH